MKKLVFATNNRHKLYEIQAMLGNDFQLFSLADIGCTDTIPEDCDTLEGNASQKAFYIYNKYKINCFADDTGLEVDALAGEPGVYSARYAGPQCSPDDNICKLLDKLKNVENRIARFRCVISLIEEGHETQFEGIVKGKITNKPSGINGFGYDPVFMPDGFTKTFAELELDEKNKISHRAIAFLKLKNYLRNSSKI